MIVFVWLILTVLTIVLLTIHWKVHPFLALLVGAISMGFLTQLDLSVIISSIGNGFGSTLRSIGIVIAAGSIIGEYLDRSGGAKVLANYILSKSGVSRAPLSMSLTGFIVSIPVFCDSGFIVLSALNKAIAKRTGIPLSVLAIALGTGLYTTHVFVPPTPGPLAAAATLGADIGLVILLGLLISVPVMFAGLFYATRYCKGYNINYQVEENLELSSYPPPSLRIAIVPILLPIVLIALKSIAEFPTEPFGTGLLYAVTTFTGDPIIALLIGVFCAFFMVKGDREKVQSEWIESALSKAGVILLITGAGGAFGAVLRETQLGTIATEFTVLHGFGVLLPFLIAAFLKTAQGSSTVAIITAAAITFPLLEILGFDSQIGKALVVLAIGAGSLTVSHINDSYFWVVSKFSDMNTETALKTHTVATLIMGLTGLISVQILAWILL